MKYTKWLLIIWLGCWSFSAFAEMDFVQAEKLYRRACATCHGKSAEKPAMGKSKIVNQLSQEEILAALTEGKINGGGNAAKQRLSDEEIKAISEWLSQLNK